MKRSRTSGGSQTGGTGDVKPQILTLSTGKANAVDQYVVASVPLPVPRFGSMKTKATVFEILNVDWYLNPADFASSGVDFAYLSTGDVDRSTGDTSTYATFLDDLTDPRTFACVLDTENTMPVTIDLTDSNGNGVLVATDKIIVTMGNVGGTSGTPGTGICKVLYRLVNVGITEYVGIVQSQQ